MINIELARRPVSLRAGDKIAICSPAGRIAPEKVEKAVAVLREQGWEPVVMPHALGEHGTFSGSAAERLSDLRSAFADPEVRAILCSRGGYGVVHIMKDVDALPTVAADPKWGIGFSDISALHALMSHKGIESIHASMAAHILEGADNEDNAALFGILRGERPAYTFAGTADDRPGMAEGILLGGNLAVLAELISTPYDIISPDTVLFIEDIAEPVYKIERILYQLRLSGVLGRLRGLVVGQFTDYKPDENHPGGMEGMIRDAVADYDFPVAFNAPIGHVFHNIPLIESARVTLKVNAEGVNSLIFWR